MLYTITHKLGGNLNPTPANQLLQQQKKPSALSAALAPLWQTVTSVDEKKQMSKKDLLNYAQGAFDIDDETHNRLMEEVKDEKVELTFLHMYLFVQFIYSEKATKFCDISTVDLTVTTYRGFFLMRLFVLEKIRINQNSH